MSVQRRFVRWLINKEAKIKLEGAEAFAPCVINDISFMGTRISSAMKLPKDTFIKFRLALSEDIILDAEAWSVWQKTIDGRYIYGFYFTKLRDVDKEKIYQFIRKDYPEQINKRWWDDKIQEKEGGEDMEDRRIFQRFAARLPLNMLNLDSGKESIGETFDVSAKGIGLRVNEEMAFKTPVELWLRLPDEGEPLYTRGEVAWIKKAEPEGYRVGVNLERADLMGLSRVLRAI